jgi:ubiquinone/menaquinone biosynthesis C-methylase UbiE
MSRESIVTVSQKWNKRVEQWHDHVTSAEAFRKVLDRILVLSQPRGSDVCVDLGAGTGFVTTALAPLVASVLAVDISPAMTDALAERAADAGLANISTEVADLKDFRLPPSHADLIVSSYALHHLADVDKRALTARAARGLRPGGRLVIADMMFGRGRSRRDRAILRQKAAALAAKGIGGWWRIAKNLTRYGLRVGPERPATPEFWQQALRDAGLAEVRFHPVAAEAGIVCGVRQRSSLRHEAGRRLPVAPTPAPATATAAPVGGDGSYRTSERQVTFTEPAHTGPAGRYIGQRTLVTHLVSSGLPGHSRCCCSPRGFCNAPWRTRACCRPGPAADTWSPR